MLIPFSGDVNVRTGRIDGYSRGLLKKNSRWQTLSCWLCVRPWNVLFQRDKYFNSLWIDKHVFYFMRRHWYDSFGHLAPLDRFLEFLSSGGQEHDFRNKSPYSHKQRRPWKFQKMIEFSYSTLNLTKHDFSLGFNLMKNSPTRHSVPQKIYQLNINFYFSPLENLTSVLIKIENIWLFPTHDIHLEFFYSTRQECTRRRWGWWSQSPWFKKVIFHARVWGTFTQKQTLKTNFKNLYGH